MQVQLLSWEDALEREMAVCSSILTWKIPCTGEPGGLQFMESQRVRQDWVCECTHTHTVHQQETSSSWPWRSKNPYKQTYTDLQHPRAASAYDWGCCVASPIIHICCHNFSSPPAPPPHGNSHAATPLTATFTQQLQVCFMIECRVYYNIYVFLKHFTCLSPLLDSYFF